MNKQTYTEIITIHLGIWLIIMFRNVLLTFPQSTKYHGENNALKKMFEYLIDGSKVIIINRKASGIKSVARYLISNSK